MNCATTENNSLKDIGKFDMWTKIVRKNSICQLLFCSPSTYVNFNSGPLLKPTKIIAISYMMLFRMLILYKDTDPPFLRHLILKIVKETYFCNLRK